MKNLSFKKTNYLFTLLLITASFGFAQNYTWMKGTSSLDQSGLYGALGVPASTNNPGARDGSVSWKDASGNFWLFGGEGYDAAGNFDFLNDLWKYTPSTNQWTWIKGDSIIDQAGIYGTISVPASSNNPGSRIGAVTWADASGNLWLFGGVGYDVLSSVGELNDLWKYTITTNQWTWIKGSSAALQNGTYGTQGVAAAGNVPGARLFGTSWTDASGNFWLFGGEGYDGSSNSGDLSDLWKYVPSTNQWTWMKGSNTVNQNGNYGSIGVAAASNLPGGRLYALPWADASGNLWLSSGYGYDASNSTDDYLNDLWKYTISSNQWTWMKGSNTSSQSGTYGTLGVAAAGNVPGARIGGLSLTDASGNFWLFGGNGYDASSSSTDNLNDLWKYNTTTNQWTWIKGSNAIAQLGTYGTQGFPSASNTPGARGGLVGWADATNNLWFFGGAGQDASSSFTGELSDLWKFNNCVAPTLSVSSLPASICQGQTATLTASGANTYTWSSLQTTASITVTPAGTTTYVVAGTNASGCSNSFSFTQNVTPGPTVNVVPSNSLVCFGTSATVTANGAGVTSYSWSNGMTGASAVVTQTLLGIYTITCFPSAAGCIGSQAVTLTVVGNPTVNATTTKSVICKGEPITLNANGAISYTWNTTPVSTNTSITVSPNITTTYVVTGSDANGCKNSYSITELVNTCTGIGQFANSEELFVVYPNPNNGEFTVKVKEDDAAITSRLLIFNALGQNVVEQTLNVEHTKIQTNLPKGIYLFQVIQNDKRTGSGKLIIE